MKEIHDQDFGPVKMGILEKIYQPFFMCGVVLVAILRIFFLEPEVCYNIFIVVVLVTSILIVLAHKAKK